MKTLRLCVALSVAVLLLGAASPALGFANRVFVSARSGNDANSCDSILTPCQTLAGAVVQVVAGGAVIVLDSGGYGPVTITQSLTIEAAPGVTAFIHPSSGNAITVVAGDSDVIILRGLVLNGGSGFGILATHFGSLHVENCVISGFSLAGIHAQSGSIFIKDTISRQNHDGLVVFSGRGSVDHCHFDGNGQYGVFVDGADLTVRDSVAAGNSSGFFVWSIGTEDSILSVYASLANNNTADGFIAYKAGAGGRTVARVANSCITGNGGIGLNIYGSATFESLGNNLVRGNVGGDVSAGITIISPQ